MWVNSKVLPIHPLGLAGESCAQEFGPKHVPDRKEPIRWLVVGETVLQSNGLAQIA